MGDVSNRFVFRSGVVELFNSRLPPGVYEIGRDDSVVIFLDCESLSRQHARILVDSDSIILEDLGSSNGIIVDGLRLTAPERVLPGQDIRLGEVSLEIYPEDKGESRFALEFPRILFEGERYQVGDLVARGGMGAILDARQCTMRRSVAMKVMLGPGDDENLARFVNEAQITGQLEHPNIVPVHELGLDHDKRVFYTMKFVMGITLAEILAQLAVGNKATLRKYPLPILLIVFQKVCDALALRPP